MRSPVRILAFTLTLSTLTYLASPAYALVMKSFTLSQLVERSDAVVLGRVGTSVAHYDQARDRIYTTWTLEVSEPVFGARRGDKLAVRLMGGVVGDRSMSISGNPTLEEGEEVFLFLRTDGELHYISGMSQGKYTVVRSSGDARLFRGPAGNEYGQGPDAITPQDMSARVQELRAQPKTKAPAPWTPPAPLNLVPAARAVR